MIALRRNSMRPIGLHWGPRSVTMAQLAGPLDQLETHALARADLPCDDSTESAEHDHVIAETITKLLADHHFKGRRVVSCLGSEELFLQNVRLPQLPPEEVEKVVCWEAEERLPYPVSEAEIRHLLAGEVHQDANIKQEVILMACHQGVLKRHLGVLEQAGLTVEAIDVEPCAILRGTGGAESESAVRHACLHLGENATAVIFADGARILFLKYVNCGGTHLDQAVARHLDLSLAEAARMRMSVMMTPSLDTENEVHRSVIAAIRSPLETLSAEIELCLRYFKVTFRGKPLEKILVTGHEATPWLAEFLENNLRTSCELGNPFQLLAKWPTSPSVLERLGQWTTAIGLSLK